jgi:hypothetical protein
MTKAKLYTRKDAELDALNSVSNNSSTTTIQQENTTMTINNNNITALESDIIAAEVVRKYDFVGKTERLASGYVSKNPVPADSQTNLVMADFGRLVEFKWNNGKFFSCHIHSTNGSTMGQPITGLNECKRKFNAMQEVLIFRTHAHMVPGLILSMPLDVAMSKNVAQKEIGWMTGMYKGNEILVVGEPLRYNEVARVHLTKQDGLIAERVTAPKVVEGTYWTDAEKHLFNGIELVKNVTSLLLGNGYILQPIVENKKDASEAVVKYGGESTHDILWWYARVMLAAQTDLKVASDMVFKKINEKADYVTGLEVERDMKEKAAKGEVISLPANVKSIDLSTGEVKTTDTQSLLGTMVDIYRNGVNIYTNKFFDEREAAKARVRGYVVVPTMM